ncbi:MAG: hypothetical protein K2M42_06775 [Oscillospiraceae bacterium]|nr:hypothetical protein [Oscillospiraceae bacterium]
MQQTKTYQLNKIDMDDTFSTAPLNENMDKLETALSLMEGANGALGRRIAALEKLKIAVGSYTGSGSAESPAAVQVGFRPKAVLIQEARPSGDCYMTTDAGIGNVTLTDTGFIASGFFANARIFNYIAIG